MKTLEELKSQRDKAAQALQKAEKKLDEKLAETEIVCSRNVRGDGCGKAFPIKDVEYIQTHWYVEPFGCTGGDYWLPGEGQWACPACSHVNRLYDKPEIEALKRLFKSVRDVHGRT